MFSNALKLKAAAKVLQIESTVSLYFRSHERRLVSQSIRSVQPPVQVENWTAEVLPCKP